MLFAGSDDGVYRVEGVRAGETSVERVLAADRVYRVRQFEGVPGLLATAESGLYHSPDGREWTELAVPEDRVYAVAASPTDQRLYAGTRPSRVFVADCESAVPTDPGDWEELSGFRELRERTDWGIPRHDGISQVRSLCTHPDAPDRIFVGVEVGGVHVSDDRGASWTARTVDGFDAPHTDDIHNLAVPDSETVVASTGSGLYRTTDAGRTWDRLDTGHRQRYFRESFVHDGTVYAGAAPGSSASWESDPDHALFEGHEGGRLEAVPSPTPEEVAIGWTAVEGEVVAATHLGTLLGRRDGDWEVIGSVPTPGSVRGRYLPLSWYDPR